MSCSSITSPHTGDSVMVFISFLYAMGYKSIRSQSNRHFLKRCVPLQNHRCVSIYTRSHMWTQKAYQQNTTSRDVGSFSLPFLLLSHSRCGAPQPEAGAPLALGMALGLSEPPNALPCRPVMEADGLGGGRDYVMSADTTTAMRLRTQGGWTQAITGLRRRQNHAFQQHAGCRGTPGLPKQWESNIMNTI